MAFDDVGIKLKVISSLLILSGYELGLGTKKKNYDFLRESTKYSIMSHQQFHGKRLHAFLIYLCHVANVLLM